MTGRVFVVGDIHGCVRELDTLLASLSLERGDVVCFLGDYVDRGPDSRAVIDLLIECAGGPAQCLFLCGNHEAMFLDFIGCGGLYGESFLENGGGTTLRCYSLIGVAPAERAQRLPPTHLKFLQELRPYVDFGRAFCVHAGIRPGIPADRQSLEDLVWIREDFYECGDHGLDRIVIYGHTPRHSVELAPPYRIGLDTGLVYGGDLTCLELRSAVVYQVARHSAVVRKTELAWEPEMLWGRAMA